MLTEDFNKVIIVTGQATQSKCPSTPARVTEIGILFFSAVTINIISVISLQFMHTFRLDNASRTQNKFSWENNQ